ncbi:sugar phosphate isomerase/epimerase [Microlunatus panaciterrae]|uniref:Sugar phosphate isomerase/epimerase n=1 Tax=Microlunatus panaciterrae TaxID=400768 RepID=A0ABS2RL61_9ACTN|nr:sugar phosphate isomerase/epimerase [Microlunatus panaciterrae]MBM7799751.1 sugar phosphate isomerase/epimerase [Microlunatus panaciterrae]
MLTASNLSLQLYTVRNALAEDLDGTLGRIAGFGYTQVEPFAFLDFADGLATGFAKYGLSAPSTHVGLLKADEAGQETIFAAAKDLGITTVIDPHTDPARWQTAEGIKEIADGLNTAAERAAAHGLTVGYHNHAFELESMIDGQHGLEVLAAHLAPEVVLEVDTYWAFAGGANVPALLRRLGDRVYALHIKDGDGSMDNKKQVGVGDGSLPVWDFIEAAPSMKLGVVELDDTSGDVFECVERSFAYLTAGKAA